MVKAFILNDNKVSAKIKFLVEETNKQSFKLLLLTTRQQDFVGIKRYLNESSNINEVIIDNHTLYICDDVRIQLEKVDYYV